MRPQYILLKDEEAVPSLAIPIRRNISVTSSIVGYQGTEVYKVVHQIDILCCYLDCRLGQTWFPDPLNFRLCPVYLES